MTRLNASLLLLTAAILSSCSNTEDGVAGYDKLVRHVEASPVGANRDFWIEMKNLSGEWERTGLIFGYVDDFEECQKAIAGLAKANDAREYRCMPANEIK